MKKTIVVLILSILIYFKSYSQEYDDRLVTSHLQVNTAQDYYASFINGFREGLAKAKAGEFASLDAVASMYNVDIRDYPTLDERLVNAASGVASEPFSTTFINSIKNVVKEADQFKSIRELRDEYVRIAATEALSGKEAETLALLDISIQEIEKSVLGQDGVYQNHEISIDGSYALNEIQSNGGSLFGETKISFETPLPRWLICGLGAIGSGIMGAISGAGTGMQIGALIGAAGAASGAIIGGALGFIGGAAVGIAKFCK